MICLSILPHYNAILYCIIISLPFICLHGFPTVEPTQEMVKFTKSLINHHLNDCYVVRIGKISTSTFSDSTLNLPVLDLNLGQPYLANKLIEQLIKAPFGLTAKHNRQCVAYYVSFHGFTELDLGRLQKTFKIQLFQMLATYSYLIIGEFDRYDTTVAFLQSAALKNFQHRLLTVPSTTKTKTNEIEENQSKSGFHLKRYCFFCEEEGGPGFIKDNKIYRTSKDVSMLQDLFPDVTKNFNGKEMRVTAPPAPPLVLITPSRINRGKNEIQGQHASILFSLAEHFNFTYTLYTAPGGLTGIRLKNGTWNGIMGEILYNRADIGLSVATSYERYQIVDVTVSVFYAFLVLVSTKPKPIFEWQAIFYPFKRNCWLAFIASTIFSFFASKWIHNKAIKYEITYAFRGKSKAEILQKIKQQVMTSYKSFYVTVGHLLEQGTPFEFDTTPSRTFILFWMFFAMIITTAYRSKLFTFLTFPTVEVPPSTFLELARGTYDYGMKHLGGIAFVFITKSPLKYIRQIGEKMTVYNDKYSCLDRTFSDRFTCIIYKAYIDYMTEVRYWKIRHNFYISDFVTPPVGSAWVLPKYAPWLPEFDRISFPIYEMGLAEKYLYDYQVKIAKVLRSKAKATNSTNEIFELNSNYKGDDDDGPKPLALANMYAAFFILLFGALVSGIIIFLEILQNFQLNQSTCKATAKNENVTILAVAPNKPTKRKLQRGARNFLLRQHAIRVVFPKSSNNLE